MAATPTRANLYEWLKMANHLEYQTTERDRLIVQNIPLVLWVYRKAANGRSIGEDELSEGLVELVRAADAFEPSRGVKFNTFAVRYIVNGRIRNWKTSSAKCRDAGKMADGFDLASVSECRERAEDIDHTRVRARMALACMDPIDRQMVVAHIVNGKLQREIAEWYGVTPCRVKQRVTRGLDDARAFLAKVTEITGA
jgi:RNA polymerase sigma factor (sigma-70 family)